MERSNTLRGFVPPHIQRRLARSGRVDVDVAVRTAEFDGAARARRHSGLSAVRGRNACAAVDADVEVHDMQGAMRPLPGRRVRTAAGPASEDAIVEAAFANVSTVQSFYAQVHGRDSIDNSGYPLTVSVHYGTRLNNAYWDGAQMLFGDGDGRVFAPLATSLEVVAHELGHAMLGATSDLDYVDQSGALNESFADVMAAMTVQWHRGHSADAADWVIGRDALLPGLGVEGLRSFGAESLFAGHPDLESDDQPKHMDGFVETDEDDGGVHVNSGIPNHAFYLAARRLGGQAWSRAGLIWFEAFVKLPRQADFRAAAEKTIWTAQQKGDEDAAVAFRDAWTAVGVG